MSVGMGMIVAVTVGMVVVMTVPVGSVMMHVHMDLKTWDDPEVFRPERFINEQGEFVKHSHLIPFSLGKRQCLGEVLARQELFLFTATLLQKFRFECADDVSGRIDDEGVLGFTYAPKPFSVKAILRC